jgi:PAS domain S-box-containing protein
MKSRILIVEDEAIEAMGFERWLRSLGYEVVGIAGDAEDALQKITLQKPDLILMDIILKGEIDGIEIADKIKESNIPVIYLTAHPEESTVNRAKLTSPYGYLTKPVNKTELKNTIELAIYKNKVESQLKESEERYRNIIENVQDAYFQADKEGKFIMISPSAVKMFKFDSKNDMLGISDISLYKNPEERTRLLNTLQEKGKVNDFQSQALRKDGTTFWASMNVQFNIDENGEILGTEGFIRDITKTKASEESIRKLYRLYTTLTQINQSVVRIHNREELFNKVCKICLDYGKFKMAWIGLIDEFSGFIKPMASEGDINGYLDIISINVKEKPSIVRNTLMAVKTGKVVIIEDIEKDLEREWREEAVKRNYHSLAAIPLKLKGQVIGNLNIYSSEINFFKEEEINLAEEIGTDISYALDFINSREELELMTNALSKSEKNYRELVEYSLVGVYKTNIRGHILFANSAMARIFDYKSVDELLKVNIKNLYVNLSDRDEMIIELKKEGVLKQYEVNMHTRSGKNLFIILSANMRDDILSGMIMDITERKNIEKVLKENEERFHALIDKSTDLIRILNQEGKIIFDSPSSQRILGYNEGFFIGKDPLDFIHPDDRARVANEIKEVFENRNPGTPSEFRIKKADGSYLPVESIAQNLTDVPGLGGMVATTRPIVERKIVEEALHKSKRLLYDIIDFLPDATFAIDHEGKIIAWNQAVEKMTGTRTEDMIGKGNYEYAVPWYGKRRPILIDLIGKKNFKFRENYDFILEEGQTLKAEVFVPSVYKGKGAYLWVTASPLLDSKGEQYGAIESVRDITERKKAVFALQRSEERFRAVAESAVDLIITTDEDGTILFCNNRLKTIFDYSQNEIIGENLTVLMPERLKKDYIKGLETFKSSGEHIRVGKTLKTIGLRKDGTEFPFEMSLASWKSGDRNFFTSIIRDITEREKVDAQIVNSLKEKEILLKEIHHRVKNNLQIISSLLDLQETYVKEDETAVNVLRESQNRVLSMAMIHEMLYQSRDLSHINFADYLRSLVSSLFHTYGVESRVNMSIDVDKCYLNVETSVPLGLIISELLSNSLKYAFPDDRNGELEISIRHEENDFELVISDDGVGFPEDVDFKNVDSSLGLQLVNSLVNQLDGSIELDRSKGTRFIIKFKELNYLERFSSGG